MMSYFYIQLRSIKFHSRPRVFIYFDAEVKESGQTLWVERRERPSESTVLRTLNLCFASKVILCITSVLNIWVFSFSALAVIMRFSLHKSRSHHILIRILRYTGYAQLSRGWLLFGQKEMWEAVWNWEVQVLLVVVCNFSRHDICSVQVSTTGWLFVSYIPL